MRRSWLSRIGLGVLGLLAPGAGLIGAGRRRAGAMVFGAAVASTSVGLLALFLANPITAAAFWIAVISLGLVPVLLIGSALATIVVARYKPDAGVGWVVPIALVAAWQGSTVLLTNTGMPARSFFIPSESMAPTLPLDTRLLVRLHDVGPLRRGSIIVLRAKGTEYIKRIVGLAGDEVELRGGAVIINGTAVVQRPTGRVALSDGASAMQFAERLPGEAATHRIVDEGDSPGDTFGPVRVPIGHVFVLGDNRDRSADSRFDADNNGVGMVPESDVLGVVDLITWDAQGRWAGRRP